MNEAKTMSAPQLALYGATLVIAGLLIGGAGGASGAGRLGVGVIVMALGAAGLIAGGVLAVLRRTK